MLFLPPPIGHQLGHAHIQPGCQPVNRVEAHVLSAVLNLMHMVARDARPIGQVLLRDAEFLSVRSHSQPEHFQRGWLHDEEAGTLCNSRQPTLVGQNQLTQRKLIQVPMPEISRVWRCGLPHLKVPFSNQRTGKGRVQTAKLHSPPTLQPGTKLSGRQCFARAAFPPACDS